LKSKFGIILGTGLSDATLENSEKIYQIPYHEIPNFKSTKIKTLKIKENAI
jgi:purine nucleoside phosphorylase